MLNILRGLGTELWCDETGTIVSAEAVMVATLGVAGVTAGLDSVSKSVNEELQDVAFAIRSLDQSFSLQPRQSAGANVAGSRFQQTSVEESHAALRQHIAEFEGRQQTQSLTADDK